MWFVALEIIIVLAIVGAAVFWVMRPPRSRPPNPPRPPDPPDSPKQ